MGDEGSEGKVLPSVAVYFDELLQIVQVDLGQASIEETSLRRREYLISPVSVSPAKTEILVLRTAWTHE